MAALRPREHPRNRAQLLDLVLVGAGARGRTAADLHALDDVNRRRLPEVLREVRVIVDERTVGRPGIAREDFHCAGPTGLTRIGGVGQGGRKRHGAHRLLERAHGDAAQPVLRIDRLPLFRHAVAAANRTGGSAQDGTRDPAAAAAHGTAATVEEGEIDTGAIRRCDERRLRPMERPARRPDPRVLVAVGVSDHHHLLHASLGEVCPVEGLGEQLTHDRGRRGEIGHGLEEWCDVQRHVTFARLTEPAPPGEHENREDVVRALRHADDVGTHGVRPKACATVGDCCEHLQRAGGLGVRRSRGLLSLREHSLQPREAVGRWARVPLRVRKQRREHRAMDVRMLSHVDRRHVEAERLDAAQQPLHAACSPRCARRLAMTIPRSRSSSAAAV